MPPSPSDSDSNSDIDDEEAPLFFPSNNNFNSATADPTGKNIDGVAFGVNYKKTRRKHKEGRTRLEPFDIELEVTESSYQLSRTCSYASNAIICILIVTCCTLAIFYRRQQQKASIDKEHGPIHHGSVPSSRWGHRFDDDDDSFDNIREELMPAYHSGYKGTTHIPKYHRHGHNKNKPKKKKLTPHDMELDTEEWEEYEMEVGHLLSAAPGKNAEGDGLDEHWIRYVDQTSNKSYYFNVEANTTQWDKPDVKPGVVIFGYDYQTGELEPEEIGNDGQQ